MISTESGVPQEHVRRQEPYRPSRPAPAETHRRKGEERVGGHWTSLLRSIRAEQILPKGNYDHKCLGSYRRPELSL